MDWVAITAEVVLRSQEAGSLRSGASTVSSLGERGELSVGPLTSALIPLLRALLSATPETNAISIEVGCQQRTLGPQRLSDHSTVVMHISLLGGYSYIIQEKVLPMYPPIGGVCMRVPFLQ